MMQHETVSPLLIPPPLLIERDYLDEDEELDLLHFLELMHIGRGPWEGDSFHAARVRDLPAWLRPLAQRLLEDGHLERFPAHCAINEESSGDYLHRDTRRVVGVNLGSDITMDLTERSWARAISLTIPKRALWALSGASRWDWALGKTPGRHASLTFRTNRAA